MSAGRLVLLGGIRRHPLGRGGFNGTMTTTCRLAIPALIFFLIGSAACPAADPAPSSAANHSDIETTPNGRTQPGAAVSACRGLWRYLGHLRDLGLADADLRKAVTCVVADFDANGSLDFLVWGRHQPSRQGLRGTRPFKILFFDGNKVVHTETIRQEDYDQAVIWPWGRGSEGACPVLAQTLDGILLPGEGGGSWYYVFEPRSRKLSGELACDE